MANHLTTVFFGVQDGDKFFQGIQQSINSLSFQDGIYTGDNIFTYGRNLSFLEDKDLMAAFSQNATTDIEKGILWRTSVVLWGVRNGLKLDGDFVECGCYAGTTVKIVCDAVDFSKYTDKHYYLYDLFDHDPSMPHHAMPDHSKELYASVQKKFIDFPNVTVTQGKVPDIFSEIAPEKIAFMHIDMNNAEAEIGALEGLFDRMVPGALLILDDYGWNGYRAQKLAEDPWLEKRGYRVLELPTGQGLVIK